MKYYSLTSHTDNVVEFDTYADIFRTHILSFFIYCILQEAPYFFTNKNSPPAQSLGDYYVNDLIPRKTDIDGNKKSNKLSGTTVAGILVGAICMVAVMFGFVYYVKRKHHNVEKGPILKQRSLYTRI